jgi:hypothetical protein
MFVDAGSPPFAIIHYEVIVHPDAAIVFPQHSCPMQIEITDRSKMPVARPQRFHSGLYKYDFYETGPVSGTRAAILTDLNTNPQKSQCTVISLVDEQTGRFIGDVTYVFNLWEGNVFIEPDKSPNQQ